MYFASVIVLLCVAVFSAEANTITQKVLACNGGYCLPKHLCPTGRANDAPILGQHGRTTLWIGEENECKDFMKICCKDSSATLDAIEKCGISNPEGLVYNVESNLTYAKYAEFPWTVAIFQTSSSPDPAGLTHIGAGTLIHPRFVLTTAHTLIKPQQYVARLGEWNMKSVAERFPALDIEIEERIPHPSFVFESSENDIALAFLKEKVIYSDHIRPLCLPSAEDVFDDMRCIATGWGLDTRTGQPASIMKRMELIVIPRSRCLKSLSMQGIRHHTNNTVICVRPAEDQNPCYKDGGSPLACRREDGSYVLAGAAAWNVDCGLFGVPSGHVDVTKFVSWIQENIDEHEDSQSVEENLDDEKMIMYAYFITKSHRG